MSVNRAFIVNGVRVFLSVELNKQEQVFICVTQSFGPMSDIDTFSVMFPMKTKEKAIQFVEAATIEQVNAGIEKCNQFNGINMMLKEELSKAKEKSPHSIKRKYL